MGVMDYYSATEIEDKEFDREMAKLGNNKQALIGDSNGVEDSLPYTGANDVEGMVRRPPGPAPGERAQMVANLSSTCPQREEEKKLQIPEKKQEIKEGLLAQEDESGYKEINLRQDKDNQEVGKDHYENC